MKTLLSASIAAFALSAVAAYMPTSVGVTEISAASQNVIIPVPYTTIGSSSAVSVHDLVKAANLPVGTMLYYYNGESYQAWTVDGGVWKAPDVAATSAIAGTSVAAGSDSVTVAVGSALWVVFQNAPESSQKIYVYGGSPDAKKTSTIAAGKTNLLSNPTSAEVSGTDLATKLSGVAAKGDKLLPISSEFSGYYVYSGTAWRKVSGTSVEDATLPSLSAYSGFWYVSKTGSGTINW